MDHYMVRQELNPENANQSRTLDTKKSYEIPLENDEECPKLSSGE